MAIRTKTLLGQSLQNTPMDKQVKRIAPNCQIKAMRDLNVFKAVNWRLPYNECDKG